MATTETPDTAEDRLRQFVIRQPCRCDYQGDGDWLICDRCRALGAYREPYNPGAEVPSRKVDDEHS